MQKTSEEPTSRRFRNITYLQLYLKGFQSGADDSEGDDVREEHGHQVVLLAHLHVGLPFMGGAQPPSGVYILV